MLKCTSLLRAGRTSTITDVSVDWTAEISPQPQLKQSPPESSFPEMYPSTRSMFFAILHTRTVPNQVVIRGKVDGKDVSIRVDVESTKFGRKLSEPPLIHTLAANRLIRDLEDGTEKGNNLKPLRGGRLLGSANSTNSPAHTHPLSQWIMDRSIPAPRSSKDLPHSLRPPHRLPARSGSISQILLLCLDRRQLIGRGKDETMGYLEDGLRQPAKIRKSPRSLRTSSIATIVMTTTIGPVTTPSPRLVPLTAIRVSTLARHDVLGVLTPRVDEPALYHPRCPTLHLKQALQRPTEPKGSSPFRSILMLRLWSSRCPHQVPSR